MTDENLKAVRKARDEAKRLNLACAEVSGAAALLHIAYDREVDQRLSVSEVVLLGGLSAIQ